MYILGILNSEKGAFRREFVEEGGNKAVLDVFNLLEEGELQEDVYINDEIEEAVVFTLTAALYEDEEVNSGHEHSSYDGFFDRDFKPFEDVMVFL